MGKKRHGPLASSGASNGGMGNAATLEDDKTASRKRIRDFRDVADSDDEFHENRDQVLLGEAPEAKRRRKWAEQEEFLELDDENVLGIDESEKDEDVAGEDYVDGEQAYEKGGSYESAGSEDEQDDGEGAGRGWGTSTRDLYGADAIETEEQALEEEAEALRLQKQQLQSMSAEDYGFDKDGWLDDGQEDDSGAKSVTAVTKVLSHQRISEMSESEKLELLHSMYPEFEPLRKELLHVHKKHEELAARCALAGCSLTDPITEPGRPPLLRTKLRAATAYLGSLAAYFALITSTAANGESNVLPMPPEQLHAHPVMDCIVQCRELWQKVEKLVENDVMDNTRNVLNATGQVAEVLPASNGRKVQSSGTSIVKSRAQKHAEAAEKAAKARVAARVAETEAGLADLDDLVTNSSSKRVKSSARANVESEGDSDFGDAATLTAQEAAEKAKRRKSLRFYTSQIAQKASKRSAAGRGAGGDDDVPYRERLRDRQARLNAEAEKRGQRPATGDAELGGSSDHEDQRQAQQIRATATDEYDDLVAVQKAKKIADRKALAEIRTTDPDEYYGLVAALTAKKKSDRKALDDARREAKLVGGRVVAHKDDGSGTNADGRRGITYAIETNKGLTPHRKKESKNPRVKKRKKFEEKKKKMASMKPVYRGGEGRGGYGGELTGINQNVVRSTKL